jgi:hypothetical protein
MSISVQIIFGAANGPHKNYVEIFIDIMDILLWNSVLMIFIAKIAHSTIFIGTGKSNASSLRR